MINTVNHVYHACYRPQPWTTLNVSLASPLQARLPQPVKSVRCYQKKVLPAKSTSARLKRKHENHPPRLPLKVIPQSRNGPSKKVSVSFCKQASPWMTYRRWLHDDEAGTAIIAHGHQPNFPVVAIKERAIKSTDRITELVEIRNQNLVQLLDAFQYQSRIYLVYESVNVSLRQIQSCPYGPLREYEISSVCQQVKPVLSLHYAANCCKSIQGLLFIDTQLHTCLTILDSSQILVNDQGVVKLGG